MVEKVIKEEVVKFMVDNRIDCEETIYQCDWVIVNAYKFIERLFKIVESELQKEDELNEQRTID